MHGPLRFQRADPPLGRAELRLLQRTEPRLQPAVGSGVAGAAAPAASTYCTPTPGGPPGSLLKGEANAYQP
jgi:hypothetical protein